MKKLKNEVKLWNKGVKTVAGVDEVGRGCFAGPLVTAAVSWSPQIWELTSSRGKNQNISVSDKSLSFTENLSQINDSKKLTVKKRRILCDFIKANCASYSIVEISPKEIDKVGVGEANKIALIKSALNIDNVEEVLVDYFDLQTYYESNFKKSNVKKKSEFKAKNTTKLNADSNSSIYFTNIAKGDSESISIASASILAKVYRDDLMINKYHKFYPHYGFDTNVGYGTKKHKESIKKHGLCEIHRKSYSIKI